MSIFDSLVAKARSSDPGTSHEAARLVKAGTKADELYRWMQSVNVRVTQLDAQRAFNNHGSTYRSRFPDLEKLGLIRKCRDYEGNVVDRMQVGRYRELWELLP